MSFLYFFIYKTRFYLFQNKLKNLDLSYKIELDFLGLFYKRKFHSKAELLKTDIHISINLRRVNSGLITE